MLLPSQPKHLNLEDRGGSDRDRVVVVVPPMRLGLGHAREEEAEEEGVVELEPGPAKDEMPEMRKEDLLEEIWLPSESEAREERIRDDRLHALPMIIRNFEPLHQRQSG
jgi:hypothetical protein